MPVVRWVLYDPIVPESYTLAINPLEGGTPTVQKTLSTRSTASPGGKTLVFEGRDEPRSFEVSGTILSLAHLNALFAWMAKRHQIRITDDLGRVFWVYLQSFDPKRMRSASHPWKHSYSLRYLELDL